MTGLAASCGAASSSLSSGGQPVADDLLTHTVRVGNREARVTAEEYAACHAKEGQACWFRYRKRTGPFDVDAPLSGWTKGTFRFVWFYDGVVAEVYEDDPDELIKHHVHPGTAYRGERERLVFTNPREEAPHG